MIALLALVLQQLDPALPDYRPQPGLEAKLSSVGSDTLNNLMTLWAEKFRQLHPGVKVEVEGKGSSTAVPGLLEGRAQLGPMARPFKPMELEAFVKAKGYPPTAIRVACDALAVFVHPDCPLDEITLDQLDAVWSKTRRRGHGEVKSWGDLGAKGDYADKPVSLYGRSSAAGAYGMFKELALLNGDFKDECKESPGMPVPPALAVAHDRYAMVYTGIGYATPKVKLLRIAPADGGGAVAPTIGNALDGRYPLSRFLWIAFDRPPGETPSPAVREFLRFVLSREGQEIVAKDGWFPLPERIAAEDRGRLAQALPEYRPEGRLEGQLIAVGDDTLNNLMTYWSEALFLAHPGLRISVEGKGGSSPMPALISGISQFAPMARRPRPTQVEAFVEKWGYPPTELRVAVDALAVFVHKDNPIRSLTLDQVDAVFSKSRRRGQPEIRRWDQLGLDGDWARLPISLYGRNSASGTYGFFKEVVLQRGDFREEVEELPGSATLVKRCSEDRAAIGYTGIGYRTDGVRAVPLGDPPVEGSAETALSGEYPLSRSLYIYINRAPGRPCDPRVKEFFRLVYSRQGMEVVAKDGYFPLPAKVALEERKKTE
jgi:phosphate transport system substrate-binding protein